MANNRKLVDPSHYGFVINDDLLWEFKRLTTTPATKPSHVVRDLIEAYVLSNRPGAKNTRTEFDILHGIKDQIDILLNGNTFKLNDLVSKEARRAVNELRCFNATYDHNRRKKKYVIPLGNEEFATVRFPKDENHKMILTTNVHKMSIRQQGFFIYVDMPSTYSQSTDDTIKLCIVKSLMITITQLSQHYRCEMTTQLTQTSKSKL